MTGKIGSVQFKKNLVRAGSSLTCRHLNLNRCFYCMHKIFLSYLTGDKYYLPNSDESLIWYMIEIWFFCRDISSIAPCLFESVKIVEIYLFGSCTIFSLLVHHFDCFQGLFERKSDRKTQCSYKKFLTSKSRQAVQRKAKHATYTLYTL